MMLFTSGANLLYRGRQSGDWVRKKKKKNTRVT